MHLIAWVSAAIQKESKGRLVSDAKSGLIAPKAEHETLLSPPIVMVSSTRRVSFNMQLPSSDRKYQSNQTHSMVAGIFLP
jgi:hypothetical protein